MSNTQLIPTMSDLVKDDELSLKDNALMVILNQQPPDKWLSNHPMIQGYKYMPIERVEWLLSRIFTKWYVEIKDSKVLANSVVVCVRLWVKNPITGVDEFQDGIGAAPIQTNKGAGAANWDEVKSDGVQKAAPSAESYAIKDAAEKFGKIFGKDVSRKQNFDYNQLLKVPNETSEKKHGNAID